MKRKTDNFNKFFNRKRTSAVKEEIRQEKKIIKKERREAVDRHFEERRNKRAVAASINPAPVKEQKTGTTAASSKEQLNSGTSQSPNSDTRLPLNKYVAHAGVSSR